MRTTDGATRSISSGSSSFCEAGWGTPYKTGSLPGSTSAMGSFDNSAGEDVVAGDVVAGGATGATGGNVAGGVWATAGGAGVVVGGVCKTGGGVTGVIPVTSGVVVGVEDGVVAGVCVCAGGFETAATG